MANNPYIVALAVVIIFILCRIIFIRVMYKEQFDWWKNNKGHEYSKYITMDRLIYSYTVSPKLYTLYTDWFTTYSSTVSHAGMMFLVDYILPFKRIVKSDGRQDGILTPKSLCDTVLLRREDGDKMYNDWFDSNSQLKEDVNAKYESIYDIKTNSYTYNKLNNGVYPAVDDTTSWQGLVSEWCGKGWVWQSNSKGLIIPSISSDHSKETEEARIGLDNWFLADSNGKNIGRGDNFLARMGIKPDAPIVVAFCNGKWNDPVGGQKLDAEAMANLIGPFKPASAGGWLGFVQGMDSVATTKDEFVNFIKTSFGWYVVPTPAEQNCSAGTKVGKGIMGFFTSALPIAVMAAGNPVGWAAAGVYGAATIVGGITAAQSAKC